MEFEWDEVKNQLNIAKHGVSFEKAQEIFDGDTFTRVDESFHYDEIREISVGMIKGILFLTVVHTDTKTGNIRLISARRANKRERQHYEKTLR